MSEEKQEYIKQYIRSLGAIEDAMEPYKEQKRELRQEFKDNGWLDADEIRAAVKAYRLLKGNIDIDQLLESYNTLTGNGGDE
jgi:allophanate hydrolase subunit 2